MIPTHLFTNPAEFEPYQAGQLIFAEGDPAGKMYVVAEGEVEIYVHGHLVETLRAGGVFGEMGLIEQRVRSAKVVAKTDCKLVPIDERRFAFLVQNTPFFALTIMKIMADRLRRADALID